MGRPADGRERADAAEEPHGLTSSEAAARLAQYGPNQAAEERRHPVLALLGKFWAPVPWMLELTVVLELLLGRHAEAGIIGTLLVFNAAVGLAQERRAQSALALLRQRLEIQARVLRDGRWHLLPAKTLAPDDVVHVRVGDMTPADVRIAAGEVLLDQSALTGESLPVEAGRGGFAYAGSIVRRGEATGCITATGARTAFGKTVELVRLAQIFVVLVATGQGTVYLVRERRHFWRSAPSRALVAGSLLDLVVVSFLATRGIFMAPISPAPLAAALAVVLLYLAAIDGIKVRIARAWL